jgi:putative DNA methylase
MAAPNTETAGTRTRRLIEEWLPITEIGIESLRERTPMTPYPAPNRLHVWWARRPLVASRAAILASLLPSEADHGRFLHALGIHGDPIAARERIAEADRAGERLGADAYGYPRAFGHTPDKADCAWIARTRGEGDVGCVLDSTAGGGSIPFEAVRLGLETIANDLNPVAWLILKTTVEFPGRYGRALSKRYQQLGKLFAQRCRERMRPFYVDEPQPDEGRDTRHGRRIPDAYLWARTVTCPYCGGEVPLSPNWRLNAGWESRPITVIDAKGRRVEFDVRQTTKTTEHAAGTVKGGDGLCPYPDCGRVIDGDSDIKVQARSGKMGETLYAVVYTEQKIVGHTAKGKPKLKKVRGFRPPRPEDDVRGAVERALADKMPAWRALGIYPDEEMPDGYRKVMRDCIDQYGFRHWHEWFSSRQMLGHCTSVEVFYELLSECGGPNDVSDMDRAALAYLALAIDKSVDYNSRGVRFETSKQRLANTFARHDFAFKWSFAEMVPCVPGLGYDWVTTAVGKALDELIELLGAGPEVDDTEPLFRVPDARDEGTHVTSRPRSIRITQGSGDNLPHIADASVDAVVLDPPYYANVSYAELSDFFYIWLKRTAGPLFPERFADYLTDKDREAVANPWRFRSSQVRKKSSGSVAKSAARDYQERMQAIFAEARRVLKPDAIMTLMFTHKATGAWDALAKGLVDAGFVITASWPVHTEAEGSLHIKDKNAAKSTIFLVCRPRGAPPHAPLFDGPKPQPTYWEEVEPKVTGVVRERVKEFQAAGIGGVDLYLSCFGPALQVFSEHWPMIRGRALQKPPPVKGAQLKLMEDEEWDPYAVRPEDALMAARSAVKQWRLEQLSQVPRKSQIDPVTEWFVLAWDAYKSPQFPADEALKLARVVGVNFDEKLRGKVLEVKGGDVIVWDSAMRAKKGSLGSVSGEVMLDALHHAAHAGRDKNLDIARAIVEKAELDKSGGWLKALEYVLNVLPTPRMVASNASGPITGAAKDAEALEKLRRLMFAKEVPMPKQWELFDVSTGDAK